MKKVIFLTFLVTTLTGCAGMNALDGGAKYRVEFFETGNPKYAEAYVKNESESVDLEIIESPDGGKTLRFKKTGTSGVEAMQAVQAQQQQLIDRFISLLPMVGEGGRND